MTTKMIPPIKKTKTDPMEYVYVRNITLERA
jgi:hypothetical protein